MCCLLFLGSFVTARAEDAPRAALLDDTAAFGAPMARHSNGSTPAATG
jgi:hypothetical protein